MESFTEHEKRADLKQLKTNLVNTICASMIAEPRFDKEDDTGAQTVVNLVEQIVQVDPEFLLKLAVYVRNDLNIRSTANFLVALAANYKESAPFLKKYFKHVINLPSDWLDVAALYQMLPNRALAGRALPTALRKAMLFKFPDFDTYQLGKYNKQGKLKRSKQKAKKAGAKGAPPPKPDAGGKSTLTLKQMVRQLHIDAPVYHVMCLLGKKYPANETDFRRSGLPGVFEPVKAGSRLKLPVPETWETLLSAKGNKAETWEELIDHKKLPFMAMLRNLRNLILTGVDYKYHRWAMNKLNNEETIARSKQFPFRFFSAYEAIAVDIEKLRQEIKEAKASGVKAGQKAAPAKGKGAKGKKGAAKPGEKGERPKKVIVPKNMPDEGLIRKYREALDNAVKFATVHNVKPIRGNTVVFCSIAESMKGGCKSARGMGSVRTLLDVGVLLGLMCKYMCEECDFRIVGAPGSHTQSHLGVELREGTVLDNMATVLERAASGELADHSFQFPFDYLEEAIRERKVIDNLIVLNDTMLYPEHDAQLAGILKKYRQEVNPELMFVSVNLGSAGKSMEASGDRHPNDVLISGFSDAILRYIAERGDSNQLHYIDHIDKEKGIQTPAVKPRELKRGFGYTSSTYSNPFRSRAVRKPFTLSGRKSFLFDDDDEADDAQAKAAKEEEARRKQAEEEAEEREVDEREKRRVEEQVEKVRSGKWRAVRVFVSSTFRDMHGERDYLVRYVFPELRERCRKRRLHFYDVDLRWGVTQEEAETEGALHICLNEIDRCRPFFIGLLGERYGWRPAAYELPEEPRYLWAKKYPQNRSITELEMFYGALRCPSAAESYFYFRNPAFASSITDEAVQADFSAEDAHAQERLKALKQEIRATFPDRSRNYSCGWAGVVGGKPMVDRLEQFGRHILEDLWKGICRTFPEVSALGTDENRLSVARESHEEYAISRTRVFVGRDDLIKTMTKFVDGDEPGPLVVTGEPGSGKSALVAQFSRLYADKNSEALVIAHYVGAATEARDIRHALLRIALELKEQLQLSEEVPEEEKELRQVFGSVLEAAGFAAGGRKVVILIDGINQMEAKDKALDWLPGSTRVRMVVSTHADTPSHHALRHRKPQPPEIAVGPLEENHRKSLVRAVLAEYRKKLDEAPGNNQMRVLLRKPESHKPLYLVLACEELRLFGLYEQLSNKIKTLGGTVPKLFDELLHRLESDHEKETLKLTLSLLVASRAGLLEAELLTILARDKKKEAELPRAVWATIFAALQPFFRPVGPSGEDALSFFHAQMEISVRKRYLSIRNNELRVQKQLANYFLQRARVPSGSGNDAWQWVDDRRAISELPHHLAKAQMWDELESVLCDLSFVKLKCRLGMAFDLLNDYNEALATEHQWDGRERLEQFQAFFAGNAHILGRYPDLTLQQAANQPDSSAPAQAAQGLLSAGSADGWVRWINKPQDQGACKLTLASERDPVLACAFSPDGKELVLASRDGTLRICDAATGAESATLLGHTNWVVACAYSYDGARIVSASWDGTLKIWDTRAGVEVATLRGHGRRVNACAFSNDGQRIASASWDCTVRLWDGYSGQLLKTFHGHTKPVNAVAFSPDGRQIVSASWDSSVKLWDVEQGTEVRTFSGHSKSVRSVQFSPTGAQIVSTSVDTTLRVWDARTGEIVTTLEGHSKAVNACAFSPDGRHLVSASDDQTVKVWDALGGREITKMGVADMSLNACDISPDGRRIVAALADCTVAVWDVLSGEIVFYIRGHTRTVNAVLFSPGGSYILTTSDDGSLKLWSARDGSLARTLTGHRDCVNDACFSPDGAKILSASDDFTLKIWDTESGVEEKEIKGHTNRVTGCAWAPDGKRVASSSRDNSLRIWSPETGDVKKIFKGHMDWLTRCAFSADGKKVVSCSWDYNMKLWDVRAGNEIATLRGHMGAVSAAAFSADGKYLVSASLDGTLKIWDPVKAHEVTALRGHSGRVSCVRFARTGTTFVSSSEDGTVRLWDAEAGQEITTLQGHADAIRQVKYCPDRDQIVSTSDDCTVKVWNAGAQREIAGHSQWVTACALASSARVLATASRDGSIKLWDTRTNRPRTALAGHDQPINCVAVSPDGATVVSASDDFSLKVWSGREGDHLRTMRHHTNSVRWVCFSPNGARVASASWDNTVCVSDPIKGTLHLTLRGHTDWVNACAFSPDGSRIATASHDQTVILWDSTTGARIHTFTHHANWVVALAFSPDSKYLASASYDATVVLTHVERRTTRSFRPHTKRVSALAFTADGAHLLSASYDGCITAHRVADVLSVTDPAPSGRFFTKAPATALCSSASLSAAGDSLGNVYQLNFEL